MKEKDFEKLSDFIKAEVLRPLSKNPRIEVMGFGSLEISRFGGLGNIGKQRTSVSIKIEIDL